MLLQLTLLLAGELVQASSTLCDQFQAVESNSYLIQTDQWGADGSGYQCLTVPEVSQVSSEGATFLTTWRWQARQELVHAFPHFGVQHDIPTVLSNLTSLDSRITWSYSADASTRTNPIPPSFDFRANVAFDFFFDADPIRAQNASAAQFEMMLWIASYGSVNPLGYNLSYIDSTTVNGVQYLLYSAPNDHGQVVYSWISQTNQTTYSGDLAHFIRRLSRHEGPQSNYYLGVAQFGSETFHAEHDVTFSVSNSSMVIARGVPPVDNIATILLPSSFFSPMSVLALVAPLVSGYLMLW